MKVIRPKLYFVVRTSDFGRDLADVCSGPFINEEYAALTAKALDESLPSCDRDYYGHVVGWTDDICINVEEQ